MKILVFVCALLSVSSQASSLRALETNVVKALIEKGGTKLSSKKNKGCNDEKLSDALSLLLGVFVTVPVDDAKSLTLSCTPLDKKSERFQKQQCELKSSVKDKQSGDPWNYAITFTVKETDRGVEIDERSIACPGAA